jgi:hypothetical protein
MTATAAQKIQFKPAVREAVGLWVQLVGGSGSGKTFSGMRLASGIAGDKPFAFIDTENRRGLHYADQFKFDHADLRAPFRPSAYADAIQAADEAGYPVIVIDSGSHVWAGDGGVLDMHEDYLDRKAGDDWKRREALKMAAWIEPKMEHKKMVSRLLQVKAHIIMCLRAEPKVEMVREGGKTVIREKQSLTGRDGWLPVADKNLPFEATCSFLLMPDHPGVPLTIKLQEQHKAIFPQGQLIDEGAGKRLAEWAKGDGGKTSAHAEPSFSLTPPSDEVNANQRLLDDITGLMRLKCGDGEKADKDVVREFLNGRNPREMNAAELEALKDELAKL